MCSDNRGMSCKIPDHHLYDFRRLTSESNFFFLISLRLSSFWRVLVLIKPTSAQGWVVGVISHREMWLPVVLLPVSGFPLSDLVKS